MAISKDTWEKARGYYEAGLTLREIEKRTGINNSSISKKAKNQQWRHGCNIDYIKAKETIAVKKSAINQQAIACADEVADDNIRRQNLVFNASEKLLQRTQQLISSNKTIEKVNVGDGIQSFQERELNTADLKNLADTVDKASITLGVNQRHANSQVTVNNTNAQQNNDNNSDLITEALKAKYANK